MVKADEPYAHALIAASGLCQVAPFVELVTLMQIRRSSY
jgi:hypothetical protein